MTSPKKPLELPVVSELADSAQSLRGPEYWRSLEELTHTDEFSDLLKQEFPEQAAEWSDPVSRRRFLGLMGASLSLAGLAGCSRPPGEQILPYVRQPENIVPGQPLFFATAIPMAGYGTGVLVESHMGRPTKIEGNPQHPASGGATDALTQAAILDLYDPDRSQTVKYLGDIRGWDEFATELHRVLSKTPRLRILTETVTSPSLTQQIGLVLKKFPQARWHQFEPAGQHNSRAGAIQAFGRAVETRYRFEQADIILSLDADFLTSGPGHLHYVSSFTNKRRIRKRRRTRMNRLYMVESTYTATGAKADQRWPLAARNVELFLRAVAVRLGMSLEPGDEARSATVPWIDALVRDLNANRGRCLILAGAPQPPFVHALAHALNHYLGNVNRTVLYSDPVATNPVDSNASLTRLVKDMNAGQVDILLMLGGNPVYTAPVDLDFAGALAKVKQRIHLSQYHDETSELCQWHVAEAHPLESWGDIRAFDGTVTIMQPLIAPLYSGKSVYELLALLTGQEERRAYDIIRSYWKNTGTQKLAVSDFETWWRKALHDGVVAKTRLPSRKVSLLKNWSEGNRSSIKDEGLEIVFRPDPTIFDGRFANNAWLQELPKPLTKLTWDNAALVSPNTATELELKNEDLVELRYRGNSVQAPIWILPGHPEKSITVHLGHGRTRAGRVGNKVGFNAYALRTSQAPHFDTGLTIRKLGKRHPLACTQLHQRTQGRDQIRFATLAQYHKNSHFPHPQDHAQRKHLSLYEEYKYDGYKWGMVIDMTACTGCNACVVACQAENNIPVVGKEQVIRERHMHWLRIDTYFKGGVENPEAFFQPVPCMHCENAPCELVCPVEATVHSSEGLNDMVYNRCVGTRYCSNNCPYKVRRFNFLNYIDYASESLKLLRNPEVTVRSRGVMEKCTYCVQRISRARIESELEERSIRDGDVRTACQAACPAGAIVFGDLNDKKSAVAQLHAEDHNYSLLEDQNTRPRTTYLGAIKNP